VYLPYLAAVVLAGTAAIRLAAITPESAAGIHTKDTVNK